MIRLVPSSLKRLIPWPAQVLALVVFITGLVVMTGWFLRIPALTSILPHWVTMKFSTALCFSISAVTVFFLAEAEHGDRTLAQLALPISTFAVLFIMITLLASTLLGMRSGVESLFVAENPNSVKTVVPGRPSVGTMICFVMIETAGILGVLLPERLTRVKVGLGYGVMLLSALAVLGYVLGMPVLYFSVPGLSTAMAFHTALLFFMLGAGIVFSIPIAGQPGARTLLRARSLRLPIRTRLITSHLTIGLVPVALISTVLYANATSGMQVKGAATVVVLMLVLGVVAAILVALLAFTVAQSLTRPIKELSDSMSAFRVGFAVPATPHTVNDEIGELSGRFRTMAAGLSTSFRNLQLSEAELRALKADLERQVAARTQELADKTQHLIESEKLNAVGTMVAGLAHELNNPLMGIMNYIDYLIRKTDPGDKRHAVLMDCKLEVARCVELDSHLLTFSRTEAEETESATRVIVQDLVESVTRLLAYRIRHTGANIINTMPPSLEWRGRANALRQVLLNVINNAIDAVKEGPTRNITLKAHMQDNELVLAIADTGPGMAQDIMDRAFDPFFTTKPVGEGTGLGLALARTMVTNQGGSIECHSSPGSGTEFVIRLPSANVATEGGTYASSTRN